MALLGGAAFLLVVGVAAQQPPVTELVLGLGSTAIVIACAWTLAAALDRGRPWAPPTAVVVLWLIALIGLLQFLVQLLVLGAWRIPLDTLLAWWVLAAWDRPRVEPRQLGRAGVVLVALVVAAQAVAMLSPYLLR